MCVCVCVWPREHTYTHIYLHSYFPVYLHMFLLSFIRSFDPYNNFKSTEKLSNLLKVTQLVNFWDRTQVQENHVLNSTLSTVPWYYFLFSLPLSFLLTLSFSLLSLYVSLSLFTSLFFSIPLHFSFPFSLFSSLPSFLPSFRISLFVSIKTLQWLTNCSYNLYCRTSLHTHTHWISEGTRPRLKWNSFEGGRRFSWVERL